MRQSSKPKRIEGRGLGPKAGTPVTIALTGAAIMKALKRNAQKRSTVGLRSSPTAGDAVAYGGKK